MLYDALQEGRHHQREGDWSRNRDPEGDKDDGGRDKSTKSWPKKLFSATSRAALFSASCLRSSSRAFASLSFSCSSRRSFSKRSFSKRSFSNRSFSDLSFSSRAFSKRSLSKRSRSLRSLSKRSPFGRSLFASSSKPNVTVYFAIFCAAARALETSSAAKHWPFTAMMRHPLWIWLRELLVTILPSFPPTWETLGKHRKTALRIRRHLLNIEFSHVDTAGSTNPKNSALPWKGVVKGHAAPPQHPCQQSVPRMVLILSWHGYCGSPKQWSGLAWWA